MQNNWISRVLEAAADSDPVTALIVIFGLLASLVIFLYYESKTISRVLDEINVILKSIVIILVSIFMLFASVVEPGQLRFIAGLIAATVFARSSLVMLERQIS